MFSGIILGGVYRLDSADVSVASWVDHLDAFVARDSVY